MSFIARLGLLAAVGSLITAADDGTAVDFSVFDAIGPRPQESQAAASTIPRPWRPVLTKAMDRDGDGAITSREWRGAAEALRREWNNIAAELHRLDPVTFARIDADQDRRVAFGEFLHWQPVADLLQQQDVDLTVAGDAGDGVEAAQAEPRASVQFLLRRRLRQLEERNPELFARLDQDGDGELNDAELAAARRHFQREREGQE